MKKVYKQIGGGKNNHERKVKKMNEEKYEESFDKDEKEKDSRIFPGKNFSMSLLLVLLAVLVGSAIAVGAGRKVTEKIELEQSSIVTTPIDTTKPKAQEVTQGAAVEVTGVPDERTNSGSAAEKGEKFVFPIGNNIIKDYSNGVAVKSNTLGDWRTHNGIDFTGKENEIVKAVKSGTVKAVYYNELWGLTVEIDHGDSIVAKYCGLKSGTTPKVGSILEQGETVGTVGVIPCEAADETHLHFEISVAGKTKDPIEVMGLGE